MPIAWVEENQQPLKLHQFSELCSWIFYSKVNTYNWEG